MTIERPDLSQIDPTVRAYIEALEAELETLRSKRSRASRSEETIDVPLEPDEAPTTFNVITLSHKGLMKRTLRHLYSRQRRGGMGIFDIEVSNDDVPALLSIADESDVLLLITNKARAFRLPVNRLAAAPVRSRGQALRDLIALQPDERVTIILPYQSSGYVVIVTERGQLRRIRYHIFKETMHAGLLLFEPRELGAPAAACWSDGEGDLFIATREGKAIRFAENLVPSRGCLGIRLSAGDTAVAVTPVTEEDGVFLLSSEGKGIIRQMSGFSPNKAPGSGGKIALKTDKLVGALRVTDSNDLFAISKLSKIIRFQAAEVSTSEGTVQGVNCMSLRADEAVAVVGSIKSDQE